MAKFQFDWNKMKDEIVKADSKKGFQKDERFWKPTVDKNTKNAIAIFRFIPDSEGTPFVKIHHHNFKYTVDGQVRYYIKNCLSTIQGYDAQCPLCKKSMELYKSAFESDKAIAAQRGRKTKYIANIYIINNPNNPEDNGTVRLFEFGQTIYNKIKGKMFPSETDLADPDFVSFIPFDLYDGADFKLKVEPSGDWPSYVNSAFSAQKPLLAGDDKKLEKVMAQTHNLAEFIAEDKFPTNEEVIKALGPILGITASEYQPTQDTPKTEDIEDINADEIPDFGSSTSSSDSSLDDDEAFFKNLKK